MERSRFNYLLPPELIAQYPCDQRTASRLLVFDDKRGALVDGHFHQLRRFLRPGDHLVLNQTKVVKARLFATKSTGGRCELLVERVLAADRFVAHVKASQPPKPGGVVVVDGPTNCRCVCIGRRDRFFVWQLQAPHMTVAELMDRFGEVPLPPYMGRDASAEDMQRYQTVYAKVPGAVAAPTAGLHFDRTLLAELEDEGIRQSLITLHVGAGTFLPVQADNIEDHHMHSEWLSVDDETVEAIKRTKASGGRVVAVGTTVVRALETASRDGNIQPYEGETNIFLHPGKPFRVVDGMITNFHLPESTLLMLVAAFIGMDNMKHLYQHAIAQRYRFYSYGDASLLWHRPQQ